MDQYPDQFAIAEDQIKEEEIINEPSLMDRISGWFTEDNVD